MRKNTNEKDMFTRHAPSRDIAYSVAQSNRVRHFLSGGSFLLRGAIMWKEEEEEIRKNFDKMELPQCRRITDVQLYFRNHQPNKSHWVTVGPRPLEVLDKSRDVIGRYLGLAEERKEEVGSSKCEFDDYSRYQAFSTTQSALYLDALPQLARDDIQHGSVKNLRAARTITLCNGDKVGVGSYVIIWGAKLSAPAPISTVSTSIQPRSPAILSIANIREILHYRDGWDAILVKLFDAGPESSKHGMPCLKPQNPEVHLALEREDVLCSVNVQHDCIRQKCKVKRSAVIRQERHDTDLRKGRVEHENDPFDIVFNTAQMRDAKYLQNFRVPHTKLPVRETIYASTQREVAARQQGKQLASLVVGETLHREAQTPGVQSLLPPLNVQESIILVTSHLPRLLAPSSSPFSSHNHVPGFGISPSTPATRVIPHYAVWSGPRRSGSTASVSRGRPRPQRVVRAEVQSSNFSATSYSMLPPSDAVHRHEQLLYAYREVQFAPTLRRSSSDSQEPLGGDSHINSFTHSCPPSLSLNGKAEFYSRTGRLSPRNHTALVIINPMSRVLRGTLDFVASNFVLNIEPTVDESTVRGRSSGHRRGKPLPSSLWVPGALLQLYGWSLVEQQQRRVVVEWVGQRVTGLGRQEIVGGGDISSTKSCT
ncbi:hypothetical protein Moror_2907 [Moniliophthora roreri MCA 2997]|uniref:Uncharacterized protein n=1 Tax=Moniliophthora roreri (strain MCA 2997) TaxID=1381753 RepID=V2XBV8_MONRO|nr:hypothetical protein Moror_2907 [Moniliophthora roreri MCA 2997]